MRLFPVDAEMPPGPADDDDDADSYRPVCDVDYNDLPPHLSVGSQLTFSITVLQASGIPADCTDVFCQFKYVVSVS